MKDGGIDDISSEAIACSYDLLAMLGCDNASARRHDFRIFNHDPVIATRFRAGEAAASVLGAQALASAELWCRRGGSPQTIEVNLRAAAASLTSFSFMIVENAPSLARETRATTGLFRARDGKWIHLHGGFRSRENTLGVLGCTDDTSAIARAVGGWDAQALEDALAQAGCCGARLRSATEWHAHPQGIALANKPVVELIRALIYLTDQP